MRDGEESGPGLLGDLDGVPEVGCKELVPLAADGDAGEAGFGVEGRGNVDQEFWREVHCVRNDWCSGAHWIRGGRCAEE